MVAADRGPDIPPPPPPPDAVPLARQPAAPAPAPLRPPLPPPPPPADTAVAPPPGVRSPPSGRPRSRRGLVVTLVVVALVGGLGLLAIDRSVTDGGAPVRPAPRASAPADDVEVPERLPTSIRPFPAEPTGGGVWSATGTLADGTEAWTGRLYFGGFEPAPWKACGAGPDDLVVPVRVVFENHTTDRTLGALYTLTPVAPHTFDGVADGRCQTGAITLLDGIRPVAPGASLTVDAYLLVHDPAIAAAAATGQWHVRPQGAVSSVPPGGVPSVAPPVLIEPGSGPILP